MNKNILLKELFTNINKTGAVTFSSRSLVNKMLSFADFQGARTIVELGGGDGSITRGIVDRMDADATLYVFEISEAFCENLKVEFANKNVIVICDSAEHIDLYLGDNQADLILSSLPFSLIPKEARNEIYRKSSSFLQKKGLFIQICYSYLLKYQFSKHFYDVKTAFTFKNFPPTFIMVCQPTP